MNIYMSRPEAAAYMRVSTRTLDRLRREQGLRACKIGGRVLYRLADLEAWLAERQDLEAPLDDPHVAGVSSASTTVRPHPLERAGRVAPSSTAMPRGERIDSVSDAPSRTAPRSLLSPVSSAPPYNGWRPQS